MLCGLSARQLDLEDLPSLPLVLHNRNESTQQSIMQWWRDHYSEPPNIGIHVTDLDTALDMVANGFGYSIAFGSFLKRRPDFFLLPLNNLIIHHLQETLGFCIPRAYCPIHM